MGICRRHSTVTHSDKDSVPAALQWKLYEQVEFWGCCCCCCCCLHLMHQRHFYSEIWKGTTLKIRTLCFVIINRVFILCCFFRRFFLFFLLRCVWIINFYSIFFIYCRPKSEKSVHYTINQTKANYNNKLEEEQKTKTETKNSSCNYANKKANTTGGVKNATVIEVFPSGMAMKSSNSATVSSEATTQTPWCRLWLSCNNSSKHWAIAQPKKQNEKKDKWISSPSHISLFFTIKLWAKCRFVAW